MHKMNNSKFLKKQKSSEQQKIQKLSKIEKPEIR